MGPHGVSEALRKLYVGSIIVDIDLLDASNILPGELVVIVDVTNGARPDTSTIAGERGSGVIGINGPAAHLVQENDIVAYGSLPLNPFGKLPPAGSRVVVLGVMYLIGLTGRT